LHNERIALDGTPAVYAEAQAYTKLADEP
jgi:hypothetical protein